MVPVGVEILGSNKTLEELKVCILGYPAVLFSLSSNKTLEELKGLFAFLRMDTVHMVPIRL